MPLPIEVLPRCAATLVVYGSTFRCLGDLGHDCPHWTSPVIWSAPA